MLPEEQMHSKATPDRIKDTLTQAPRPGAFRGIRTQIQKLHPDLLPPELQVRVQKTKDQGAFVEVLREVQRHLEHFHNSFQRIWSGQRRVQSIPKEFKHQRNILDRTRRRMTEAAQFLFNTFWTDHETEGGLQKNWHGQNSIPVPDLLVGMNELRVAGLVPKKQADLFKQRILDLSGSLPATRRPTGDRRIDPNTVRTALISAWGASELEYQAMRSWDTRTLNRILRLPTR